MAFRCNPELRTLLNAHSSKLDWATILNNALTNTRRIRCFRDSNANAADPVLTGVEFRNVASTGTLKTTAGSITGLGRIKGSTVKGSADMFTGRSMLRVEGGGHWFDGTLGPSKEAQRAKGVAEVDLKEYDFYVDENFTATNGLGVKPNLSISGPRFSPSGVGASAPAMTAGAPRFIEIWNYSNPASPTLAGTLDLDPATTRQDNFVLEDQYRQLEIGDIGVYQTNQSVTMGEIEFGATLLVAAPHNRDDHASNPTEPLYQIAIPMAVRQSVWPGYPSWDNFNPAVHTTYPVPHKIVIKNAAGQQIGIIQMHDGSAVNSIKAVYGMRSPSQALIPNVHAGMVHQWENIRPRISSRANKVYSGLHTDFRRPSMAKQAWAVNGVEPLYNGGYGQNSQDGIQHLYAMPQWPQPRQYYYPAVVDPYLDTSFTSSGRKAEFANNMSGWDFEPGSFTGHNFYTGPGGPRFDRAAIPSAIALMVTFPTGSRLQDNTSWRDIGHAFIRAYGNHGNHWCDNVNRWTIGGPTGADSIDMVRIYGTYYSNGSERWPGKLTIDTRGGMRDDVQAHHLDKNGQFFWGGWSRDGLHNYGHAGHGAWAENNPLAIMLSKWDTMWTLVTNNGIDESGTNGWHYRGDFLVRNQAWTWLSYILGWTFASKHPLGITREKIEAMFVRHCEDVNRSIVTPFKNGSQDDYIRSLRSKGQPWEGGETKGGGLGMYMAGVLALAKQTGFWDAMKAKGGKVAETMLFTVECLDKYCYDILLTSAMRYYPGQPGIGDSSGWPTVWTNPDSTWAQVFPPNGQLSMTTNIDGSYLGIPEIGAHPFMMWPYMRRDYLTDVPNARTQAACDKIDAILARTRVEVDAQTTPAGKRDKDFGQGYPGIAPWAPPLQVGPA